MRRTRSFYASKFRPSQVIFFRLREGYAFMHVCSIVRASDLHFRTIKQKEIRGGGGDGGCFLVYQRPVAAAGDAASQAYLMLL